MPRTPAGLRPGAAPWLSCDAGDELEVLVEVQDGRSGLFGCGGDEHVGDVRRAVLALTREQQLDLDRAALDRCGQVLGRLRRQRRVGEHGPGVLPAAGCESGLKSGRSGDAWV